MGGRARTRNHSQADNKPYGWMDEKGLAGASIRLFMEGDFDVVRSFRGTGTEEIGKAKAEYCPVVETKNSATCGLKRCVGIFLILHCDPARGETFDPKRIFCERRTATLGRTWPWPGQGVSKSRTQRVSRPGRSEENRFSNDATRPS